MNPIPKTGQRWHFPAGCNRKEHPGAKSVRIVAIFTDPQTGERLITMARWARRKRCHFYDTEPLALFEWSLKQGMWAKGPLPNGPNGESNG